MKGIENAVEVQPICKGKEPPQLSADERACVVEICDQALLIIDRYMELHAEAMPDRGCEGTLISVYYTPPALIKKIRKEYGGVGVEEAPVQRGTLDAPPQPIQFDSK